MYYDHTSSQPQKHLTVESQTQISVILSQNQQQRIVPVQQLFQHSWQPECSPVKSQNISVTPQKKLSSRNSLHDVTATLGKTLLCKIWKSADLKNLFYVHPYNVVLNFTEFKKKYLKIHEFYWILNVQVLNSQSM